MKKILLLLFAVIIWANINAQTYQYLTPYDTIVNYGDTLNYSIPVTPGIWGDAELCLIYQIDNGDNGEYMDVYSSNWTNLGQTPSNGNDCTADSFKIMIPADSIIAWTSGGNIHFQLMPSSNVDLFCVANHARLRLSYHYCTFGTPVALAELSMSDTSFCPYEEAITLSGTPAGGTFSGPAVSGSTFNPAGLAPGFYEISYQATDGIGCVTIDYQRLTIKAIPTIFDTTVCPNTTANLHLAFPNYSFWFTNPLSSPIDSGYYFLTPALSQTTTYYVQNSNTEDYFRVTSFADTAAVLVDFDALIGDDRGGIAVTPNYVYFLGDNGIGRFNHDLDPATGTFFNLNDGLFSDLKSGKLLSLWDGNSNISGSVYNVNSFQSLDSNMNVIETLALQTPIVMGSGFDYGGIYAGYGFTVLYSGINGHFYVVNNSTGSVNDLGDSYSADTYGTENWADWGIAEYDGTDYHVVYRDYNSSNLMRLNLTNGDLDTAAVFSDLSDCSTITYSPWDNRWYLHFEGGSQWIGSSETGAYLNATDSIHENPGVPFGCYAEVNAFVNVINLGSSDTTICINESVALYAGLGYESYTWNGVTNNWNVYVTNTAGVYTVEVVDSFGCTLTDQITVIVDSCTGITEPEASLINIFPNPFSDFINIEIPSGILEGNSTIAVSDAQGRIVLQEFVSAENGCNYQFNVQSLDKGLYQLIITSEKKQFAYRLIRQ